MPPLFRGRFRAPAIRLTPELRWVLQRAFGPIQGPAHDPVAGPAAAELARRLDLQPRIAARCGRVRLEHEVGEAAAARFLAAHGVAAASSDRRLAAAAEVEGVAGGLALPLAWLKGTALTLLGLTPRGGRWMSDVDALLPESGIEPLRQALLQHGWREPAGGMDGEHELAKLASPSGNVVELHRFLPGVRLPGARGFASFDSLRERGLLRSAPGTAALLPAPSLLVAHALVHGLAQHGFAPWSYPLTRMLADLADLGLGASEGMALLAEARPLIEADLPAAEAEAARGLVERLHGGDDPRALPAAEAALLSHALAGLLDRDYASALKLRALGSGPARGPRALHWVRQAGRALFPSRAQLEALRGHRLGPLGLLAARAARPFDLAWRAVRSARAAVPPRAGGIG